MSRAIYSTISDFHSFCVLVLDNGGPVFLYPKVIFGIASQPKRIQPFIFIHFRLEYTIEERKVWACDGILFSQMQVSFSRPGLNWKSRTVRCGISRGERRQCLGSKFKTTQLALNPSRETMLLYLLLLPLGAFAYPRESEKSGHEVDQDKLKHALFYFGLGKVPPPVPDLEPVHLSEAKAPEEIAEPKDYQQSLLVESEYTSLEDEAAGAIDDVEHFLDIDSHPNTDVDNNFTIMIPTDHHVLEVPPEPDIKYVLVEKPVYVLHHPANDDPADLENDVYHIFSQMDTSRPICSFFQHSVLGEDFGESTFPRVSYVNSELPFRVHYAPDDDLRFESYKWPFSACNHACELQALKIRALFDRELDPVNKDSALDDSTKAALKIAREICQWKNVHHHFAVSDCPKSDMRKRFVQLGEGERNVTTTHASAAGFVKMERESILPPMSTTLAPTEMVKPAEQSANQELYLSDAAQAAMNEIRGIFASCKGPKDLSQMFHTVILACQIHRYTSTPMVELAISSMDEMVTQAMSQVRNVFVTTDRRIDIWETRDAIVRATQIYRYQEEQHR